MNPKHFDFILWSISKAKLALHTLLHQLQCIVGDLDQTLDINNNLTPLIKCVVMQIERYFIACYNYHYEKSHLSKPHYPTTKTQKTTHIQLLYNYPLGITTTMQLSP
jgi:hypothetical protein